MQERAAPGEWQVTCQCGWRVRGSRETIISAVQEHGRSAHGQDLTEEQVMTQAVPAGPA
jgi:hypothetical protein